MQEKGNAIARYRHRKAGKKRRLLSKNRPLSVHRTLHRPQNTHGGLKYTQEQLLQSEKLRSLGIMASGIAHELNNPLTAILGTSDIVLYSAPPDAPWKKDLEEIKKAALECKDIINNLLSFARNQKLRFQTSDIHRVIDRTLNLCQGTIDKSNIKVIKQYAKNLPSVEISVARIQGVFTNIILNAVDAMPHGGTLTITTSSKVINDKLYRSTDTFKHGQEVISIVFTDTGKGIPKKKLTRVFVPFFTTKEPGRGTGLGLTIAYWIVQQHNGRIIAQSQGEGRGAVFTVTLPRDQQQSRGVQKNR